MLSLSSRRNVVRAYIPVERFGSGEVLPLSPTLNTLEVLTEDRKLSGAEDTPKFVKLPQIRTLVIGAQAQSIT